MWVKEVNKVVEKKNEHNDTVHAAVQPLVSIGIPSYNRSALLKRAVASIQNQSYKNIEIIISDNASPDDTKEVCSKMQQEDDRIQYFRQQNPGINFIYNNDFVLQQANGKYYMWLADDDWLGEDVIGRYVDFMEKNSTYSVISGQFYNQRKDGSFFIEPDYTFEMESAVKRVSESYKTMHYCGMYYGFMRKELILKIPLYRVMLHDWVCLGALAAYGKVKTLNFPGYYKKMDGLSGEFVTRYASLVGSKKFEANFAHLNIAIIVFSEIIKNATNYRSIHFLRRIPLAFGAFWAIVKRYYVQPVMESKSKRKGFARNVSRPFKNVVRETAIFKFFKKIKQNIS